MTGTLAIIGGTGFIGRAVARAADDAGYEPVLLAPDDPKAVPVFAADTTIVPCDVTEPGSLAVALRTTSPAALVHLAAYGSGARGLLAGASDDPQRAVSVNVGGFVNVVEAAAAAGLDRVVWSSSTTVYGPASGYGPQPVDETARLAPQTVYGATKASAELLSESLEARTGVRPVALRLPLVYGPGRWYGGSQEGLVGFVRDVAAGRPARLEADDAVTDWIYITDAATAVLDAVGASPPARAYNLVGHRGSLADVGDAVAAHARADAEVVVRSADGLGLPLTDDRAARRDLGFAPRHALMTAAADYVAATTADEEHHADTR
ncbi:MAG: NAD-dependent epimerase/dehydratase family protein [Euzebyales bacterium]|nr:NAD-dependent epimerase/dehydratase family protein [Euzebyales bacterium]